MIKFKGVKEIVELAIFFIFAKLDVVLLETVKSELCLIVHVDLKRCLHELLADRPNLLGQCSAEHHHLFLGRRRTEDLLDITPHICVQGLVTVLSSGKAKGPTNLVKHFVTLIQDKDFDAAEPKFFLPDEGVHPTGCGNNDVWMSVFIRQGLDILGHRGTAVKNRRLDSGHVLAETLIFVFDLVCQFAGMTHDEYRTFAGDRFHLLKCREDKDSCFPETRLGLA